MVFKVSVALPPMQGVVAVDDDVVGIQDGNFNSRIADVNSQTVHGFAPLGPKPQSYYILWDNGGRMLGSVISAHPTVRGCPLSILFGVDKIHIILAISAAWWMASRPLVGMT